MMIGAYQIYPNIYTFIFKIQPNRKKSPIINMCIGNPADISYIIDFRKKNIGISILEFVDRSSIQGFIFQVNIPAFPFRILVAFILQYRIPCNLVICIHLDLLFLQVLCNLLTRFN